MFWDKESTCWQCLAPAMDTLQHDLRDFSLASSFCYDMLRLSDVDTVNSRLSSEEIYMCDSLLDLVPKAACRGSGKLGLGVVGTLPDSQRTLDFSESDMLWEEPVAFVRLHRELHCLAEAALSQGEFRSSNFSSGEGHLAEGVL